MKIIYKQSSFSVIPPKSILMGRFWVYHLVISFLLIGCMDASRLYLSSELRVTSILRAAYKSSETLELQWSADSRKVRPDYYSLEYSKEGADWVLLITALQDSHYQWQLQGLAEGNYRLRLISHLNKSKEVVSIGEFIIDDQAPLAGADMVIHVTEDVVFDFSIPGPVENDQYVLIITEPPSRGTLQKCLTQSNVLDCRYVPDLDNDVDDVFKFQFKDRAGNLSREVTVNVQMIAVNDAPVITTLACPTPAQKHHVYSCTIQGTDVDLPSPLTLSYHLTALHTCSWLSIDNGTGVVSGTPGISDVDTDCTLSVVARDDQGLDSASFDWDLRTEKAPPVIVVTSASLSLLEDSALTNILNDADVSSLDEGAGGLYSIGSSALAGDQCQAVSHDGNSLLINTLNGEVRFRPAQDYQGICRFQILLEDTFGERGYREIEVTVVNVQDVPQIPVGLAGCSTQAMKRSFYSCEIDIYDPDPEELQTVASAPSCPWLNFTYSQRGRKVYISGTPSNLDVGTDCLLTVSTDDGLDTATENTTIQVLNVAPNLVVGTPAVLIEDDPIFLNNPVEILTDAQVSSLDEGFGGQYSLGFSGLSGVACNDGSVIAASGDLSIHLTNGRVLFKPREHYYGECFFKIIFDDQTGHANSNVQEEVKVIVTAVNDRPVIVDFPSTHEILLDPTIDTASSLDLLISVGPLNESHQVASLICSSNNARLVAVCDTTRVGDGVLAVNLLALKGLDTAATLTIQVKDDGGGDDTTAAITVAVSLVDAVVLDRINTSVNNFDIFEAAKAQFSPTIANSSRTFVLYIDSLGRIESTNPQLPALRTGSLNPMARVRIVNQGNIVGANGRGGDQGIAQAEGEHGGTALKIDLAQTSVHILNSGGIWGGGGGGGRGGQNLVMGSGEGGHGEGAQSVASHGNSGAGGGGMPGGEPGTAIHGGGLAMPANENPDWFPETAGAAGQGGNSCQLGATPGNGTVSTTGYAFGRGGLGAGHGGGAGNCSDGYAGGGGGGYFGGGGGSGGLSRASGSNSNSDINGAGGGNGGAAIEVPTSVTLPSEINIQITSSGAASIAGAVWNDFSQYYLVNVVNDSDPRNRSLTFSPTAGQNVHNPNSLKIWHNGRGNTYR